MPHHKIDQEAAREQEQVPVLSYEEYRGFCDEAQPDVYRKTGIDGRDNYEVSVEDSDTVYIEMDGHKLPLFVPLGSAGGYNIEGTSRLTSKNRLFALAIPPHVLDPDELNEYLTELGDDVAVVVQTGVEQTQSMKEALAVHIGHAGWHVGDFIDPRCPEKNKQARISIYTAGFEALDEEGNRLPFRDRSLKELFEEDVKETGETDTVLVTAQEIRDNEELFDQLWELHNDRFDWLGEYHPVSMQETKAFFKQVISDDHTTSFVRFDNDEGGNRVPVCHGCFVDNLDLVEWINDRFKQEIIDEAEANDEKVQFFYGIVSKSTTSAHYAKDVMRLHSRIDQRNGGKVRLLFESTNKSSLYIPRMVQGYTAAEPNGVTMTEPVEAVSRLDYWYLASESSQTV